MQVNDSDGSYRQLWNETHFSYAVVTNESFFNDSSNHSEHHTYIWRPEHYSLIHLLVTSIILGTMILCTIIGNVFVVAAIILERNLQSVANYLIMSLAVADLMVASLVMPISAVHEVTLHWFLGAEVCDMWISFDVLCCTASILHLVAIALDRYFAVTQVDYIRKRTAQRVILMIVVVWGTSIAISIPPLFGWKDKSNNPNVSGKCVISQDPGYTIFSTGGAFYVPLFFMIIIYYKIFRAARSRIRKTKFGGRKAQPPASVAVNSITAAENATCTQQSSSSSGSPEQPTNGSALQTLQTNDANKNNTLKIDPPSVTEYSDCGNSTLMLPQSPSQNHIQYNSNTSTVQIKPHIRTPNFSDFRKAKNKKPKAPKTPVPERPKGQRERIEHKRERKAARTLAIVTGCFIICWVPFFVLALIAPICGETCHFPEVAFSVVLWLGYLNSLLNPVIYTIFNPDFRNAFRKILFGKYRNRNRGGRGR